MDIPLRIVTRPDLDGMVCALLLREVFGKNIPVLWTEPGEIDRDQVNIKEGDAIANLPFQKNCFLWFDHHQTNKIEGDFNGKFEMAPSAAGIIFDFYKDRIDSKFTELVSETNRIDSGMLNESEILDPMLSPYFMLSITIKSGRKSDSPYWDHILKLLSRMGIEKLLKDKDVAQRIEIELKESKRYRSFLNEHTTVKTGVSVTDFRGIFPPPSGNRFLVFSLFPESNVNVKIRNGSDRDSIIVSVGHSIFKRECKVHCGNLMLQYGGGGHFGAGSCSFPYERSETKLKNIIEVLMANQRVY